jgi:uncharacterized protein YndB with AHSA1/START domain
MTTPSTDDVRIQRTMQAPPDQVYRAWLDPAMIAEWLAPGSAQVSKAEVDARVGGHYRIWHTDGSADVGGFEAEIEELIPNELIVMKWGFVGPDRLDGPVFDSLLTIRLAPGPDETTELTLLHQRLDELHAAMPYVGERVAIGWEAVLDKLTTTLGDDRWDA